VPGVNFGSKLLMAKDQGLLEAGGGHAMAAGFTAKEKNLSRLQEFLNNSMSQDVANYHQNSKATYDLELSSSALTEELIESMSQLEPYGHGNPEPRIRIRGLFVLKADIVGGNHISCLLAPDRTSFGTKTIKAIAFHAKDTELGYALLSRVPHTIDIIATIKLQYWQDRASVSAFIKDVIIN